MTSDRRRKKEWQWPRPDWMQQPEKDPSAPRGGPPSPESVERAMNLMMATARPK
ncbi:hypothetical protein GCM10017673_37860 [Streptosporangium violaceochromogenes]|nr:hypothetical protein GCM10017673_37860 [Streptosporangium violaceochromogenes]